MTCVAPALAAEEEYTEHSTVYGSTGRLTLPGATWGDLNPSPALFPNWDPDAPIIMEIGFAHYDSGDHGPRDSMYIEIYRPPPSDFLGIPVAWVTDTKESAKLYRAVMTNLGTGQPLPTVIPVLKPWKINIYKIGKTVILSWTKTLKIKEQTWYPLPPPFHEIPFKQPAVRIPPGFVVLRAQGEPVEENGGSPPETYGYSDEFAELYDATGFLYCRKWREDAFIPLNTPGETALVFDATFYAYLPNPT